MKAILAIVIALIAPSVSSAPETIGRYTLTAGHESLQEWLLPKEPPYPKDNYPTRERISLGKKLFFDPRLSRDGNMSCATCHNPLFGWSDGLPTGKGFRSQVLGRATPTITNTAYNFLQMWDGRKKDLEDQATGPLDAKVEMNADMDALLAFLKSNSVYASNFEAAYPGQGITRDTLAMALASFERTVVSQNSPFDQWVRGDKSALNEQEINGFKLFLDREKGNCAVCHSAPNFTDNGFHNIGLAQWSSREPDLGRHNLRPIGIMKGAFKTPTLRDISLTAPYFHDGSAENLDAVVDHYIKGGEVKTNLSPNMKASNLNESEKQDLIAFLRALTSPQENFVLPDLPLDE